MNTAIEILFHKIRFHNMLRQSLPDKETDLLMCECGKEWNIPKPASCKECSE